MHANWQTKVAGLEKAVAANDEVAQRLWPLVEALAKIAKRTGSARADCDAMRLEAIAALDTLPDQP